MTQSVLKVGELPVSALEAASLFHAEWVHKASDALDGDADNLAIVLPAAAYDHTDWRRAAAHDLARAFAPKRVNIVGGEGTRSLDQTLAYLDNAAGVTGHYLPLDGEGAGDPLG